MITREQFDRIHNCQGSLDYVATQPDLVAAWENCNRPDWLITFATKAGIISKEQAIRIAIGEAETVLPLWVACHPDDKRPQQAIDAAKAWLANQSEENAAAAYAAGNAADHAVGNTAAAAYAAYAASNAADAAYAAYAYATDAVARTATYAATFATSAAHVAAADAASTAARAASYADADMAAFCKTQCNRIRAIIPNPFKE